MKRNSLGAQQLARWALAMVCALATAAYAAPAKRYHVYELARIGGIGGSPRAISNHGVIAGGSYLADAPNPIAHAVVWENGTVRDIGASVGTWSQIEAMNEKGTMVGLVDLIPHMWKDGTATPLPFSGNMVRINRNDAIVGNFWTSGVFGFGGNRAFVYQDGLFRDLGTLNGGNTSHASDINDKGDIIVGYSQLPRSSDFRAVVWENGVIRELPGLGGQHSAAGRILRNGLILGNAYTPDNKIMLVAWNLQGAIQVIAEGLSGGAVNDKGAIAGNDMKTGKAFLLEDGQLTNLSELPEMKAAGWVSFSPFVMNDRGWIAGPAWKPGVSSLGTAVLLVPVNGADFGKQ